MTGQLGNPGRSWATRILTLGYYLFLIIVTATYTANLTNVLTAEDTGTQITSFSDLEKGQIVGTVRNSAASTYIRSNPIFNKIKDHIKYYTTFDNLISGLRKKEIEYLIFDSPVVGFYAGTYPCDTQEVKEIFGVGNYAIAIPLNSTYSDEISQAILILKENGKIDELISKWLFPGHCDLTTTTTSIGLQNFGGVFICFGFLIVFCTCIIIIEIIFNFSYKALGDKFPWLLHLHIFFGGGEKYLEIEEPKSIKFNNPKENVGSNINMTLSCV